MQKEWALKGMPIQSAGLASILYLFEDIEECCTKPIGIRFIASDACLYVELFFFCFFFFFFGPQK